MRCLDLNDFLLKSISFGENLFSSPRAQSPPFQFIRERDHGRRRTPCRSVLKFIPLMCALILAKSPVLIVVKAFSLLCHSPYLT